MSTYRERPIMDEIKYKILGLLNKQSTKIPSMGFSDTNYQLTQPEAALSINSKTVTESDRPADQDILESIQAAYFSMDENFDICKFELTKLPNTLDCDNIQNDFKSLKQQHQVVSKKVLQLILEHQSLCNEEFRSILDIRDKLSDALHLCQSSRSNLNVAQRQFSTSLSILANYRKRKLVQNLLNNLNTIKTLHCTEFRLQELLNEENYAGAIELLQECQAVANTYRHFTCVAALTNKLQETLENTEEKLDKVLAEMCFYFDNVRYSKLQAAYGLLGKTQIAVDHLHMHFTSAIYTTALNIVRIYATADESCGGGETNDAGDKKPYDKLCPLVTWDAFIPCLVDLCKALFKIVLSYHQLNKWHLVLGDSASSSKDLEENLNRQYVKQKLESGLFKIWHDVQGKVSLFLLNANLASYKFDQFVQILGVVHRLIEVGEEFCGSKSEELLESIRKQSVNYFKSYHVQRLEELKIFLENESWEICPVKPSFNVLQLQEFKSLRSILTHYDKQPRQLSNSYSPDCSSSNHSQDGSSVTGNYFLRYADHGNPFDKSLDETLIEEDILLGAGDETMSCYFSDESEEESDELKQDFVAEHDDEITSSSHHKPSVHIVKKDKQHVASKVIILTNTALSVLRQMGKYLQMSRLLRSISLDIVICMMQLFDFYLYSVHSFFASDLPISGASLYSLRLKGALKRISDNLVFEPHYNGTWDEESIQDRIQQPQLSSMVDLNKSEKLHGLASRVAGVESLVFLAKQYEMLQGYLEHLLSSNEKLILQQFFNQTTACVTDLRKPIYMCVAAQAFDLRQVLVSMSKVNWEVKDVMSQHNSYVDVLLRQVQIFTIRLENESSCVFISLDVVKTIWENIAHIITHTLVQGFSEAKKCTNGGRALMQLDFTQFLSKFEKMSSLRPVPHKEYVEYYVKAFYLPDVELEKWIREHTEYSSKQLFGLISCSCQNNKKTKQRLMQIIEEVEKNGQR